MSIIESGLRSAVSARRIKPGDEPPPSKEPSAVRRTLAANVKLYREALGLSQAALADLCEMTQRHVWSIESGAKNVTLDTVTALAANLGKTEIELLTPVRPSAQKRKR